MRLFSIIAGLSWVIFIVVKYYGAHPYYFRSGYEYYGVILSLLLFLGIVYLAIILLASWKAKRVAKKTGWKILQLNYNLLKAFLLMLIVFLGIFQIIVRVEDISIFRSGYSAGVMARLGNSYSLHSDRSQISENSDVIFEEGMLVKDTAKITRDFPEIAKALFQQTDFLSSLILILEKMALPLVAMILLISWSFVLGRKTLQVFLKKSLSEISELNVFLLAVGTGLALISLGLFLLGAVGKLDISMIIVFFGVSLIVTRSQLLEFYQVVLKNRSIIVGGFALPLMLILTLLISFNLIDVLRPIPVSWDEISEYLNVPNLIAAKQTLIARTPYAYGLLMSLGFIVFKSASVAMAIGFLGSILAIAALIAVLRQMGVNRALSLFLGVLQYSLPFFYWQSAIDIKIDPALFFFSNLVLLAIILFWREQKLEKGRTLLFLAGFLLGFVLSIKYSGIILLSVAVGLIAQRYFGKIAAAGVFLMSTAALQLSGFTQIDNAEGWIRNLAMMLLFGGLILAGISLWKYRSRLGTAFKALIPFFLLILLPFGPWLIFNGIKSGNYSLNAVLFGNSYYKPPWREIGLDPLLCGTLGGGEELQRYTGGQEIQNIFWRLPYDLTMNRYVSGEYVDISFIFLALIPTVLFVIVIGGRGLLLKKILGLSVLLFWYFGLWAITGYGIIWYGLAGFAGLWILLARGAEIDIPIWVKRGVAALLIGWLLLGLPLRYYSVADQRVLAYNLGLIDAEDFRERLFFGTEKAQLIFQENPEAKILRIGSFLKYWIPNNDQRVIDDDSMQLINCLYFEKDSAKAIARLKKMGVRYIVLDKYADSVDNIGGKTRQRFEVAQTFVKKLNLRLETGKFWMYEVIGEK